MRKISSYERCQFNKDSFILSILDLRMWIHLGCSDEEKFYPQLVTFEIDICFKAPVLAAFNDRLEDTVCYLGLVQFIEENCKNKRFNLVEYLTQTVYRLVCEYTSSFSDLISQIRIKTNKKAPPVRNVHGGISFVYHVQTESMERAKQLSGNQQNILEV